jgi:hypothetical protein
LIEKIPQAIGEVSSWFEELANGFREGFSPFTDNVMPRLQQFYEDIQPRLAEAMESLRGLGDKLREAWERIGALFDEKLGPALNRLAEALGINTGEAGGFGELLGQIVASGLIGALEGALLLLEGALIVVTGAIELFTFVVEAFVTGLETVVSVADGVLDAVGKIAGGFERLTGIDLPDWLEPGSPPPLANALRDIGDAIERLPDMDFNFDAGVIGTFQPALVGSVASGGTSITIAGDIVLHGVQDGRSLIEELTELARG